RPVAGVARWRPTLRRAADRVAEGPRHRAHEHAGRVRYAGRALPGEPARGMAPRARRHSKTAAQRGPRDRSRARAGDESDLGRPTVECGPTTGRAATVDRRPATDVRQRTR